MSFERLFYHKNEIYPCDVFDFDRSRILNIHEGLKYYYTLQSTYKAGYGYDMTTRECVLETINIEIESID